MEIEKRETEEELGQELESLSQLGERLKVFVCQPRLV